MADRKYDLLAVDLDGTLFDSRGRVPESAVQAIERARREGLEVVICTGRAYVETQYAIDCIRADQPAEGRSVAPIITTGGAAVVDAMTGDLLHVWRLDRQLVREMCERFASFGRAPLILKHRGETGYDYAVVRSGPLEYPTEWWFDTMDLHIHSIDSADHDQHPDLTIRIGFAAITEIMSELAESLMAEFANRAFIQFFPAVSGTHKASPEGGLDQTVQLLEVFHPSVNKWNAIETLAESQGIPHERIAAVGDQINDLAMVQGAALGIAMGNATDALKDAADVETESNDADGLAGAIDRILSGAW